jgi:hypothetical protein
MLAFESRVDLWGGGSGSSVNLPRCGRGGFGCGTGRGRGCGGRSSAPRRGDHGRQGHQGGSGSNSNHPQCQVCLEYGHTTDKCWYRYDEEYVSDPRQQQPPARTQLT